MAAVAAAALAAPTTASPADPHTLTLLPDPLDLSGDLPHDYRNWAAVLAQMMLVATEGSEDGSAPPPPSSEGSPAVAALGRVLLATHARLARLADGDLDALFPRFHVALDNDKLLKAFGKAEKVDPKWAAHMGLDGAHPLPAGCETMAPMGNMTNMPHMGMDAAAADGKKATPASSVAAPARGVALRVPGVTRFARPVPRTPSSPATPPQAPQPAATRRGGRALAQAHDHTTPAGGGGGGGMEGGHDHMMDCHSMTGHVDVHKLMVSKAFLNFEPCVLQEKVHGVHAGLTGLRFAPRILDVMASGFMGGLEGVRLNPSLIYFAPMGLNVQPQGFNFQPGLVYLGPVRGAFFIVVVGGETKERKDEKRGGAGVGGGERPPSAHHRAPSPSDVTPPFRTHKTTDGAECPVAFMLAGDAGGERDKDGWAEAAAPGSGHQPRPPPSSLSTHTTPNLPPLPAQKTPHKTGRKAPTSSPSASTSCRPGSTSSPRPSWWRPPRRWSCPSARCTTP